jgi:type IV pilus assembly protein PilV
MGNNEYLVTIAWQGLVPISAPPNGVSCGKDLYDTTGTRCVGDLCRRTVTTLVRIGALS